jgi:hypothetical protein
MINNDDRATRKADKLIQEGKDDKAFSYLMLNARANRANNALWKAYKSNTPKCDGREADFIDYDEDNIPTPDDAYMMCEGCPVLVECARMANAYKPPVGVWGGNVWKDGEIIGGSNGNST